MFEELYAASGTSTMESAGKISLSRDENIINVNGYVDFHLYDIYDWHKGLKAILRTGVYDDSDAQLLQIDRGAKPYRMSADWRLIITGQITIRRFLPDTVNIYWR